MKRLLVGAIGLVVAWFFCLMAIAVLGIIAAIAIPNVQQSNHLAAVHTPMASEATSHEMVGYAQTQGSVATEPAFAAIINALGVPPVFLSLFAGTIILTVLLGTFVIAWRFTRRTSPGDDADSQTVQELYHLGNSLDKRMESLETILLERSRPAP